MKTFWLKRSVVVIALFATRLSFAGSSIGVDPAYVKLKAYEIRVSPNADCTGAITVFQNASPSYQDMVHNPTLGSGAIPDGTYNCVMMKMSDFIHYTPASLDPSWTHGACVVGADYVSDVGHDETAVDPDGTAHPLGPAGTENIVWLYVRTGATVDHSSGSSAFAPSGGIPLTSPLVVNGDGAHTMVFDFSGRVGEGQNNGVYECGCEAPTLGFR